jgi:hypothetical protein
MRDRLDDQMMASDQCHEELNTDHSRPRLVGQSSSREHEGAGNSSNFGVDKLVVEGSCEVSRGMEAKGRYVGDLAKRQRMSVAYILHRLPRVQRQRF